MSITQMRKRLGAHLRNLLWVLLVAFGVSCFYMYGSYLPGGTGGGAQKSPPKVIAKVNRTKITRNELDAQSWQQQQMYAQFGGIPLSMAEMLRAQSFELLVDQILKLQDARKRKIRASKSDIQKEIGRMADQQMAALKAQIPEKRLLPTLKRIMASEGESAPENLTEKDFGKWLQERIASNRDEIKQQVILKKLEEEVRNQVKIDDAALRESFDEVRARHILIRMNPVGAQEEEREKARKKTEGILAKIKQGADFAALAKQNSEDPGSAQKGGDLGFFGRDTMYGEFEKVAFSLQPGQVSEVVETPFGFHIIKVEEKRQKLPPDFAKKKEELKKDLEARREQRAWADYQEELKKKAKIKIFDPEIRGAKAIMERKPEVALQEFQKAEAYAGGLPADIQAGIHFAMGDLYSAKEQWKEAAQAYERCLQSGSGSVPEVYMALGNTYAKQKNTTEAVEQYKAASEVAYEDQSIHQQLKEAYKRIGRQDLALQEKKWLDDYQKRQKSSP